MFLVSNISSEEISIISVKLLVGAKEGARKTHWSRKEILFAGKQTGGLGLKNMQLFNMALLAKQCWRILQNPNSLLSRVLKMK